MQQLEEEALEAIKSHHDKIFQDWIQHGVVCFKQDSTPMLPNYGFQLVVHLQISQCAWLHVLLALKHMLALTHMHLAG
jgi:hypothetical protein